MLSVTVQGYGQTCTSTNSGGLSRLWVGDADDFTFTAGTTNAQTSGYSAIARRGADEDGRLLYEITSLEDTLSAKATQSITDGAVSWAYEIGGRLIKMQQSLSQFAEKLDAAAICGQLLWIWEDNNGLFWVAGEKWIGTSTIPKFKIKQDGSVIDWGAAFNQFNGMTFSAKGNYRRPPYTYTGGSAGIIAMTVEPA
jgi:GH24 family phage-related lysozyme (muramidase)